jgi:hypothetical protein
LAAVWNLKILHASYPRSTGDLVFQSVKFNRQTYRPGANLIKINPPSKLAELLSIGSSLETVNEILCLLLIKI